MACLCAPTSHEGSFRCRLHRAPTNPAQSSANYLIKSVNCCTDSYSASSNQIGCAPYVTVRESPSASVSSTPHHIHFSHTPHAVPADPNTMRMRLVMSSSSSDTFASSSLSHRLPSASPASSASSRASASSSSSSPSAPIFCMRPPPVKRSSSPAISLPSNRILSRSSSSSSSSSWCGASGSGSSSPSASHAAALAIMKQHTHNRHGAARTQGRNPHSPTGSAPRIGPSRLSRMAVASATDNLPLQEKRDISSSPRCRSSMPDAFSGSLADTPSGRHASIETAQIKVDTAQIKAMQIGGLKAHSTVNKFKQSESSCRIVGSKEGSLIMPTVY